MCHILASVSFCFSLSMSLFTLKHRASATLPYSKHQQKYWQKKNVMRLSMTSISFCFSLSMFLFTHFLLKHSHPKLLSTTYGECFFLFFLLHLPIHFSSSSVLITYSSQPIISSASFCFPFSMCLFTLLVKHSHHTLLSTTSSHHSYHLILLFPFSLNPTYRYHHLTSLLPPSAAHHFPFLQLLLLHMAITFL